MARVLLAMSGGVDSSVSAHLLREQGHEVIGVFMRHGMHSPVTCSLSGDAPGPRGTAAQTEALTALPVLRSPKQGCCSAADAEDARRVADRLNIPFYVLNFEEEFREIIDYFVNEYLAARTPNPCVVCNNRLKFGRLFEYADTLRAEFVATGHYARLKPAEDGLPGLFCGRDPTKDQSYVLFGIRREYLGRLLFPVGDYTKQEIRAIAAKIGLRVADKPDSQEICFVPNQDHAAFVRQFRGERSTAGEIVDTQGRVVGYHDGLERFTIGQRKGLKIAFGEPRYVVRLEPDTRRVVVGTREDLARWELTASEANWLVEPPTEPFACTVKIRYRTRAVPATVTILEGNRFHVQFHEPCYGVAPGQAAVCYQGERVLGGGWID
ncbi:tRNA 2-thiouridine(34) synthase MnmA [Thermogutta sp.]|jgi:tRNA-specific 2-thiouridylase|uniref:tRNA 2-thiouridine(34) synthase MnmA n=1 Tax=Thermogutta sp. TaxID=1962930 RepID=UPI0032202AF7